MLIWQRRRSWRRSRPRPTALGLLLLAGAGAVWLVADAGEVQVVQQYAMVAMIRGTVIAILGREVARAIMFPLGFLLLGVPIGEALIPPLMDWTADFTVAALRLSGIPVFREGMFFTIPSGNWSVVEGCSGLRYLIASITVGVLFAYLSYQKLWKRLLFVALSIVVPIIANGCRAYMIVMIAHLSDKKLAHGSRSSHLRLGLFRAGDAAAVLDRLVLARSRRRACPRVRDVAPASRAAPREPIGAGGLRGRRRSRSPARGRSMRRIWIATSRAVATLRPGRARACGRLGCRSAAADRLAAALRRRSATLFQVYRKGDRAVALSSRLSTSISAGRRARDLHQHHGRAEAPGLVNLGESRVKEAPRDRDRSTCGRRGFVRPRSACWSGTGSASPDTTSSIHTSRKCCSRGTSCSTAATAGRRSFSPRPMTTKPDRPSETLREFARDMMPSIDAALARVEADNVAIRR